MPARLLVLAALLAASSVAAASDKTGFVSKTYTNADGSKSPYLVFVPHRYNGADAVPVILFLHGAGERKGGKTGKQPVEVGIGPYIRKHEKQFPFLVVFPQAEGAGGWRGKGENGDRALAILDKTLQEYKTDPKRVYLTGLSMGGGGTWSLAAAVPERWAAIVPICGRADPMTAEKIKDIPCWVFHGAADDRVPVTESRDMVAALKKAGGGPRYTEYPKLSHNSWDRAYATPELWTWLAKQRQK